MSSNTASSDWRATAAEAGVFRFLLADFVRRESEAVDFDVLLAGICFYKITAIARHEDNE